MTVSDLIEETIKRGGTLRLEVIEEPQRRTHLIHLRWKWPREEEAHLQVSIDPREVQHWPGIVKRHIGIMMLKVADWLHKVEPPIIKLINALSGRDR